MTVQSIPKASRRVVRGIQLKTPHIQAIPALGGVTAETANVIEMPAPDLVDVLIAFKELDAKLSSVPASQKIAERKLRHIAERTGAIHANLINCVDYLAMWMWDSEWSTSLWDVDIYDFGPPPPEPHWQ